MARRTSASVLLIIPAGLLGLMVALWPWPAGRTRMAHRGTRWICRMLVSALGVSSRRLGPRPPHGALLVANHLSWLDILTVLASYPCVFVAKREVQSWPLIGTLADALGVIFIDRTRRRDILRVLPIIEDTLRAGRSVLLFAEGTTSNGGSVLPFRTGLVESAVQVGAPVVPLAFSGTATHGDVDALCWYGDESLIRNLPRLIALRGTTMTWHVGAPIPSTAAWSTRKTLTRDARHQVIRRFRGVRRTSEAPHAWSAAIEPVTTPPTDGQNRTSGQSTIPNARSWRTV